MLKNFTRARRHAADRAARMEGPVRAQPRSDHAGQGGTRAAERYLARCADHDRPQESGRAPVQRFVDAFERAGHAQDGKQVVVQLVNYSAYPMENVTVQVLGKFKHAHLLTPEGVEKELEVYTTDEGGTGVDIDKVSACATVRLD